jgi:transposase-like protein
LKEITMTNATIALTELAEKGADIDVLRQMVQFMAQRLMELDVEARCGAGYDEKNPERINSRNGYRERAWDTRAGSLALKIPKLRSGAYFPGIPGAPAHRRESADRCHPGGLHPGHLHPLGGRPGQSAGNDWGLQEPGLSPVP